MPQVDPAKLGDWFDQFAPQLLLYARQLTSEGSAEDLVQEAFLRLADQEREPGNLRAWLFTALRNAAISSSRSDRRRTQREQRMAQGRTEWFDARIADLIDAKQAQSALEKLSQVQREAVVLRIWAQLSFQEIAELMSIPISTVYDQYKSALAKLRQEMESSCRNQNR